MMISFTFGFSMLAIFLVVLAQDEREDDVIEWRKNSKRHNAFECGQPQPRSFTFKEINTIKKEEQTPNNTIFPWTVVLHRCQSAGCCSDNKVCQTKKSEIVTLVFLIDERRESRYLRMKVKNDTLCSCQTLRNSPK